ncbi:MAG: phosphoenolpyruvate carboxylase [Bifidobacterium breve]
MTPLTSRPAADRIRPAKRGLGAKSLDDLRTIPWVFSWAQARINWPHGTAWAPRAKFGDLDTLREAYEEWPLFSRSSTTSRCRWQDRRRIARCTWRWATTTNWPRCSTDGAHHQWVLKSSATVAAAAPPRARPGHPSLAVCRRAVRPPVLALKSLRKKVDRKNSAQSQQAEFIYLILCIQSPPACRARADFPTSRCCVSACIKSCAPTPQRHNMKASASPGGFLVPGDQC